MSRCAAWLVFAALGTLPAIVGGCRAPASQPQAVPKNYVETIRGTDVRFEMVWIPEGRFWIGRTEVTWDEYLQYCDFEESGKVPPGVDAVARPSRPQDDVTPFDRDWGTGRRPAVGMSWNAARNYCRWLSLNTGRTYRLPTEAEWRLACGEAPDGPLRDYAWYEANSDGMTHEVGLKKPNRYGLHDMLGNLWEYCANPFSPAEPERAVLRGGSWSDPAERVTPDSRLGFEEDWVLDDPNVPPGVWWVPAGDHLGMRVLRPGPVADHARQGRTR